MSRIGLKPIPVPPKVQVDIEGATVTVKGPKGDLVRSFSPDMEIALEEGVLHVRRPTDSRMHRSLHGLTRTLLANMVQGVSEGFTKILEIVGTGYRAEKQGRNLMLHVGYSHPVEFKPPEGIEFEVPKAGTTITILGRDKELVGEMAARIRRQRPPEPYQGKGVRYAGEHVRRKAGKAGKVGKGKK
jgi:large subunit ribosomal protein L6